MESALGTDFLTRDRVYLRGRSWSQMGAFLAKNNQIMRDISNLYQDVCFTLQHSGSDETVGFPWWVFGFIFCLAGAAFFLLWTLRGGGSRMGRLICSVFYDVPQKDDREDLAERALRRWRTGEPPVTPPDDEDDSPASSTTLITPLRPSHDLLPLSTSTDGIQTSSPPRSSRAIFTIVEEESSDEDDDDEEAGLREALHTLQRAPSTGSTAPTI